MAIEFKDVSEPAASQTTPIAELPIYQTTVTGENASSINTTNHPLELTVVDSVGRRERNENDSLKYTIHMSQVNSGVIIVKIAEMVRSVKIFI